MLESINTQNINNTSESEKFLWGQKSELFNDIRHLITLA